MGGKITGKFLENRPILNAKEKPFTKPEAELTIFPVSKISPKKSLLIQQADGIEKSKYLEIKFYIIFTGRFW